MKNFLLIIILGAVALGLGACKPTVEMPADAVSLKVTGMT